MSHITVLKAEAVDALSLTEDSVVIDCTLGAGGHADTILQKLGTNGIYVGIDADASAVEAAKEHFASVSAHTHFVTANFKDIVSVVAKLGIPAPTAILADLGLNDFSIIVVNTFLDLVIRINKCLQGHRTSTRDFNIIKPN